MHYQGKWSILMCPLVPVGVYFLSDLPALSLRASQEWQHWPLYKAALPVRVHTGKGYSTGLRLSKPTSSCSPEALWKHKQKIQNIFSQKKSQVNAFWCGCCKRQSFQMGLVLNTDKLNSSQGQKKQFNLHKSIDGMAIYLPAARMKLWGFK